MEARGCDDLLLIELCNYIVRLDLGLRGTAGVAIPNDLAVNGAGDAVLQLEVHLGN